METPGSANRIPARFSALAPRWIRPVGVLTALVLAVLLPTSSALAADFAVTNTNDDGAGSLRVAIALANLAPGADSISISATGTIDLVTPLPVVEGSLSIAGPGQNRLTVRRNRSADFRIFEFEDTFGLPADDASVSGMTISNGRAASGGGIRAGSVSLTLTQVTVSGNEAFVDIPSEGGLAVASGGGVAEVRGSLTMRDVTVTENQVLSSGGPAFTAASGGGVSAGGVVRIEDSTISGNSIQVASPGGQVTVFAQGAGFSLEDGSTTIERSTISGNSVNVTGGGEPILASGGGIASEGALTVSGSTITANSVAAEVGVTGANIEAPAGTVLRDSIVSDPKGEATSCRAPLTSQGFNIEDGGSCGFTQPTDLASTNPGIDPNLSENGGPTPTHALLPGSVAIDRGNAFGATVDQRGLPRPSDFLAVANLAGGDGSDVGAVELQAPAASPPRDTKAPNTRIGRKPARRTRSRLAVFRFSSTEAGSSFQCKLDRGRFRGCRSPFKRRVKAGPGRGRKHTFQVRALDRAGNLDRTPAKFVWRVVLPG
jgi:hypothetical protein